MRIFFVAALMVTVATAAAATTATVASADTARAFVQQMYDHYAHDEVFSALDRKSEYFDASTMALLDQNVRLLAGGESTLGADPLCVCQDTAEMAAEIRDVHMTGATTATALVFVTFAHVGDQQPAKSLLALVFEKGRWRIHDVTATDAAGHSSGSLRDALIRENSSLAAHGHD